MLELPCLNVCGVWDAQTLIFEYNQMFSKFVLKCYSYIPLKSAVTVDLFAFSEIDKEGVIEPDNDEPQDMEDFENIEVKCLTLL